MLTLSSEAPARDSLKDLLARRHPDFWPQLFERSRCAGTFDELLPLSTLRRRACALGFAPPALRTVRLALVGGYSLYPLHMLVEHMLAAHGIGTELFLGDFDNYTAEMMDPESALHAFRPDIVFLLPSDRRCRYEGRLSDPPERQRSQAADLSAQILDMCRKFHERTRAEILLANFRLPTAFDPGPYRVRTLGSDWSFRKLVNVELGLNAPPCVHICDVEFLAYRRGGLAANDDRAWFTSKQPCAADFLVDLAREAAVEIESIRTGPRKVLVLDLDNTLWGGVVGDDGLEGIEIGDTSPRGEAFKAFQKYIRTLIDRGVLLAVCSKNDHHKAMEPFLKHPEMVLKPDDFVSFKANWNPKSENIREIAAELGLGLDSFVFVDDNPAEIDIVRQFVPGVATILLGPDPADYVRLLADSRYFEPRSITAEDSGRTALYRQEADRKKAMLSATDMPSYLASLDMVGIIRPFDALDAPRIAQLINKSNQFNLTTRRRTEADVLALGNDPDFVCFTVRLRDRFGDHGLISVAIGRIDAAGTEPVLEIDTWLMSCRVLNRQVEEEVANELVRLALRNSCRLVRGAYLPTARNGLVSGLLPKMGFQLVASRPERVEYELDACRHRPFETKIRIIRDAEPI
jgi:FkbH-like protein